MLIDEMKQKFEEIGITGWQLYEDEHFRAWRLELEEESKPEVFTEIIVALIEEYGFDSFYVHEFAVQGNNDFLVEANQVQIISMADFDAIIAKLALHAQLASNFLDAC